MPLPPIPVPRALRALELVRVRLPLRIPHVAAHGNESERDVVLVHAVGAGPEGWGECSALSSPTYTTEHTAQAWDYLRCEAVPSVLACRGGHVLPDAAHPMAWCGIEVSLADLDGADLFDDPAAPAEEATAGPPPYQRVPEGPSQESLPVGRARRAVPFTVVLGQAPSAEVLAARVREAVADGAAGLKVKITPESDSETLATVRSVAPAVPLAADANCSYQGIGAPGLAARELGRFDLHYVEQPFAAGDLASHARAVDLCAHQIALDESVSSLDDLQAVIRARAASIINVKPARVGGLRSAYLIANQAAQAGLGVFVGGMIETGVGRSAALRLAALDLFDLPTDLGPSHRYFEQDLTDPILATPGGEILVPDSPPLVLRPRPTRLAEVTVERLVIHA